MVPEYATSALAMSIAVCWWVIGQAKDVVSLEGIRVPRSSQVTDSRYVRLMCNLG